MDEHPSLTSALLPVPRTEVFKPEAREIAFELPALIVQAGPKGMKRFLEFFTVNIRNENTCRAYGRAAMEFLTWCENLGVSDLSEIEPMRVAAFIERKMKIVAQTAKQSLAALRMLFDWLMVGLVIPVNPAASVRGSKYSTQNGKTPVLGDEDTRALLDGIDTSHVVELRDRARYP